MSLRPPKKSDLGKTWMKPRGGRVVRIQPEYHLIVTEGMETEPAYFRAVQDAVNRCYRGRVQLDVSGEGRNTLSLFDAARRRVRESLNGYRHVWIVYDTDDFPPEHVDQVAELAAQYSGEETTYHAVWSNQCFELWFLLHFSYFQSDLHRSGYWPKLTECLQSMNAGSYRKNREDLYALLRPRLETAIANARRLEEQNRGKPPSRAAPGTRMHELMETLLPYLPPA